MNYRFSEYLVLRSPLFPQNEILEGDVFKLFSNKIVKEAIFLASPQLYYECIKCINSEYEEDSETYLKIRKSLFKYLSRMHTRATPFGLFAGCSILNWGDKTKVNIIDYHSHSRKTRLDMNYLCDFGSELEKIPEIRENLNYKKNTSLYLIDNEFRYVEYLSKNSKRFHKISSIENSYYLNEIYNALDNKLSYDELVNIISRDGVDLYDSKKYINNLIENQFIVSELQPTITGEEYITHIQDVLDKILSQNKDKRIADIKYVLDTISYRLNNLDTALGNSIDRYEEIIEILKSLEIEFSLNKLFQVDLYLQTENATIDNSIKNQLLDVVKYLKIITPKNKNDRLEKFKQRFIRKYESQEIQVSKALDSEFGVGYDSNSNLDENILINDLVLPRIESKESIESTPLFKFLHEKIIESKVEGRNVIKLDDFNIENIIESKESAKELPDTMSVMFSQISTKTGEDKFLLNLIGGSTAGNLIARFSTGQTDYSNILNEISEADRANNPDTVFAEIVHLPESRIGNVLQRASIGNFEIPYLAQSTLAETNQIEVNDLYISIQNDTILLKSKKLKKNIIPRLTSAHNFSYNSLPVYQFLCDLQSQNKQSALFFSWEKNDRLFDTLPRIEYKNFILSPAYWLMKLSSFKKKKLSISKDLELFNEFRIIQKIPKNISIVEGDNELHLNLEYSFDIEILFEYLNKRKKVEIVENFSKCSTCVKGKNDSSYSNQFVAFLYKNSNKKKVDNNFQYENTLSKINTNRVFHIGSKWLYFKFYSGTLSMEKILVTAIPEILKILFEKKYISQWFFIRFFDIDNHLRFRVKMYDKVQLNEIVFIINKFLDSFVQSGMIWKIQTDTYLQELERYGANSMELSEDIFFHDSTLIINTINQININESDNRHELVFKYIDQFLEDFNYRLEDKVLLMDKLRTGFYIEFKMNRGLKSQIDKKYRINRDLLIKLLENNFELSHPTFNKFLLEKSKNIKNSISEISNLIKYNKLQISYDSLVASHIHMMVNRLFKSEQRLHELIIYDFLFRHYTSKIKRLEN